MSKAHRIDFQPRGWRASADAEATLFEAARQAGVGLNAVCGGIGHCGGCLVRVVEGRVSPPTSNERDLLSAEQLAAGFRLACQTHALGDLRLHVPPESLTSVQRAQVEGREPLDFALGLRLRAEGAQPEGGLGPKAQDKRPAVVEPVVRGFDVILPPPTLADLQADVARLQRALVEQHGVAAERIGLAVLRRLSPFLRDQGWRAHVAIRDGEVVGLGPAGSPMLGLAVDIGTTKLAGYLVDLESGETLAAAGGMNPQIAYGEDVMARISHAMRGTAQARELREAVVGGLNELADELCARAGCDPEVIVEAVLVGNTAMHHLVLGLPVAQLGLAPYVPVLSAPCDVKARELGLTLASGAYAHFLPLVAGFVGADHVAMLLATGLHKDEGVVLGLDIGTNTEITLAVNGRLLACSCASGPAFEGAHIRDGMRAAPGAIERLRLADDRVEYYTVDDAPPVGLCGSGVLDAVAGLRRAGVLAANGRMEAGHPRVRQGPDGAEFVVVRQGEGDAPRDLVVTRKDVNQIQLAKSAIRAGIEVLLAKAGLEPAQVQRVVVAGAFGTYLDLGSALAVGMFPPLAQERFDQVGNAAGMGAKLALVSRLHRAEAAQIARRVEYVELTADPRFTPAYAAALRLP